jgi:hypothetical protein
MIVGIDNFDPKGKEAKLGDEYIKEQIYAEKRN